MKKKKSEPRFVVGDRVEHVISGEVGAISRLYGSCETPGVMLAMVSHGFGQREELPVGLLVHSERPAQSARIVDLERRVSEVERAATDGEAAPKFDPADGMAIAESVVEDALMRYRARGGTASAGVCLGILGALKRVRAGGGAPDDEEAGEVRTIGTAEGLCCERDARRRREAEAALARIKDKAVKAAEEAKYGVPGYFSPAYEALAEASSPVHAALAAAYGRVAGWCQDQARQDQ